MYGHSTSEGHFDPDSFKGPLNLPFALFGEITNNLTDTRNSQMFVRGIDRVRYYPQSEVFPRRQYVIALDIWNFDYGWQNTVSIVIILSSIIFISSLKRA